MGTSGAYWEFLSQISDIDAVPVPVLKQNIIALYKYQMNCRNFWRLGRMKVSQARQSDHGLITKGAGITLGLLPNMLLRALSALERNMRIWQNMDIQFSKFLSGQ